MVVEVHLPMLLPSVPVFVLSNIMKGIEMEYITRQLTRGPCELYKSKYCRTINNFAVINIILQVYLWGDHRPSFRFIFMSIKYARQRSW